MPVVTLIFTFTSVKPVETSAGVPYSVFFLSGYITNQLVDAHRRELRADALATRTVGAPARRPRRYGLRAAAAALRGARLQPQARVAPDPCEELC